MKTCNRCGFTKETTEFQPCKSARDGFRRSCKTCLRRPSPKGLNQELAREAKRRYYLRNKEEVIERASVWREANRERANELALSRKAVDPEAAKYRARGYALKRKYGLSLEQYEELLDRQDRCCAICRRHEREFKTSLAVDHSHRSGRIRGALCTGCNYRLVARHEDADLLRKVADYIEQGTEWFVPDKKKKKRKPRGK